MEVFAILSLFPMWLLNPWVFLASQGVLDECPYAEQGEAYLWDRWHVRWRMQVSVHLSILRCFGTHRGQEETSQSSTALEQHPALVGLLLCQEGNSGARQPL